jgi:hypothetical protein
MENLALFAVLIVAVWQFEKMKDQIKSLKERQEIYAKMISVLQSKVSKLEGES